jgi:hypothetical protein
VTTKVTDDIARATDGDRGQFVGMVVFVTVQPEVSAAAALASRPKGPGW